MADGGEASNQKEERERIGNFGFSLMNLGKVKPMIMEIVQFYLYHLFPNFLLNSY